MKIYIVRHGETTWNAERRVQGQSDSVLNAAGQRQAEELRPWVDSAGITTVYSSTNTRAQQTTRIIAAGINLPVSERDDLREISLGPWEQLLWSDIAESDTQQCRNFREFPHLFNLEGAETFNELRERGIAAVNAIVNEQESDSAHVLIVSHGALVAALLSGLASVSLARLRDNPSLGNCSVSEIHTVSGGGLQVISVAGTPLHETGWFG